MANTHFAVYYYQGGRWSLHASFEADEKDLSVEEAKSVEFNLGYPSQVVRETYFPDTNATQEKVIYKGAKAEGVKDNQFDAPAPSGGSGGGREGGSGSSGSRTGSAPKRQPAAKPKRGSKAAKPKARPAAKKRKQGGKRRAANSNPALNAFNNIADKATDALVKICVAAAAGLLLAMLCAGLVIAGLFQLQGMGLTPPARVASTLTYGAFILGFLYGTFMVLRRQFNIDRMLGLGKYSKKKRATASGGDGGFSMSWDGSGDPLAEAFQLALGDEQAKKKKKKGLIDDMEFDTEVNPGETSENDGADEDGSQDDKAAGKDDKDKKKAADKKAEKKKAEKKAAEKKEKTPQDKARERASNVLFTFLTDALTKTSETHPQLNAFSKFGLSLYMAGAVGVVCQTNRIEAEHKTRMIRECLKIIGSPPTRIDSFLADMGTYSSNPRQRAMMNEGAKAVTEYMAGMKNAVNRLGALLEEWSKPEKRSAVPNVVTFLFTDIVGSTAMTQALGNAGAQKVVRAHNDAVRGPLKAYGGSEVKHTGDGIMATFPNPPAAVAASAKMLEEVARHNAAHPDLPLKIRIGVNAGEAVAEDNDYFGAAVQITARICDKARDGQAWVSETIVAACEGQNMRFVPRGGFAMKGIDGEKPLFEIAWTRDHLQELDNL